MSWIRDMLLHNSYASEHWPLFAAPSPSYLTIILFWGVFKVYFCPLALQRRTFSIVVSLLACGIIFMICFSEHFAKFCS